MQNPLFSVLRSIRNVDTQNIFMLLLWNNGCFVGETIFLPPDVSKIVQDPQIQSMFSQSIMNKLLSHK